MYEYQEIDEDCKAGMDAKRLWDEEEDNSEYADYHNEEMAQMTWGEAIFAATGIECLDAMLYEVERIMALDDYFGLQNSKLNFDNVA